MSHFVVLSLPRSRSAWLSKFLSYREWECGHDQLRYMRSLDDIKNWLALDKFGTCETAGAPFWRLLLKYAPDIRVVTVRRPVDAVIESLSRIGLENLAEIRRGLVKLDCKLDQVEGRMPNVKSIRYDDLGDEVTCGEIFEFCLPYGHDRDWWRQWNETNVQINFPALTRYVGANMRGINKVAAQAAHVMFSDLARTPVKSQSVIIEEESFQRWESECAHLFRDHWLKIDENPDSWLDTNIPQMRKLYEEGYMQILIARSNGRPFGYLMTLISPSLEAEARLSAQHTAFYSDSSFPGLGLKLQRAAAKKLKERGVYEIFMRAGIRGNGNRMGSLYKRLGAEDFGKLYRVELGA